MMRTLTFKRSLILSSIWFVLFASRASAQTGTTSLRGSVLDKSGAAVVGATVRLNAPDLAVQRSTVSNDTGQYEFLSLKPGSYEITVEAANFRKYDQRDIQLLVNNPTTLNVTLQVGCRIWRPSKCPRKRKR